MHVLIIRPSARGPSHEAIPLNYQVRHEFSPFSCPIFLGHPEARGRCSQGERVLYGRGPVSSFGRNRESRSREAAGRRNWLKLCPEKCVAEKGQLAEMSEERDGGQKHRV